MSDKPIRIEVDNGVEVSTLELKDVIILRGTHLSESPEAMQSLAELTGCLIMELPGGGSVESLSEAEMNAAGWSRTPGLALKPCDCGTHYKS